VRLHTCYGINEGPRIYEAALEEVAGHMLKVNAGACSFEAANPRHEHEYHLWETVKLPEGKVLIPGAITHASNIVEHPELIAERLLRLPGSSAAKMCWPEPTAVSHPKPLTTPRYIPLSFGQSSKPCGTVRAWRRSNCGRMPKPCPWRFPALALGLFWV
jgi:hypothetical protein